MDLAALVEEYGAPTIAEVVGVTPRTLTNLRLGQVALTVDDFYELERRFPGFDLVTTVRQIGEKRHLSGRNRKSKRKL